MFLKEICIPLRVNIEECLSSYDYLYLQTFNF